MKKMTKFLLIIMIGVFFLIPFSKVKASSEPVKVYLFYGNGCPYCENALAYFASIEEEYGDKFDLVKYEVWYDSTNSALLQAVAKTMGDSINGVPYFIIGDKSFSGYSATYNEQIIEAIENNYGSDTTYDVISETDFDVSSANGVLEEVVGTGSSNTFDTSSNQNNSSEIVSYVVLIVLALGLVVLLAVAKNKAKEEN